jgi:hypothetical protein
LAGHDADADDLQIPLLLWWALERHASEPEPILAVLANPKVWKQRLVQEHLVERLARRWTVTASEADREASAKLFALAPSAEDRHRIVQGLNAGLRGQHFERPPAELASTLAELWTQTPRQSSVLELGLRLALADARVAALAMGANRQVPAAERTTAINLLAETRTPESPAALFAVVSAADEQEPVRLAALTALGLSDEEAIGQKLLDLYGEFPSGLKPRAIDVLASRKTAASLLVAAAADGSVPPADVTPEQLRQLSSHQDPELDQSILRIWGQVRGATPEERLAVVRRLNNDLRAADGDPAAGLVLFR